MVKKKQLKFIGGLSLEDIQKQIYYYEKQKSDTEQKIRRLQSEKSSCIAGAVLSSIFLPFTLGISSVGVAETTMDRNVINRQISELEDDLRNYNRRLNLYYKKEAELLK